MFEQIYAGIANIVDAVESKAIAKDDISITLPAEAYDILMSHLKGRVVPDPRFELAKGLTISGVKIIRAGKAKKG